MRCIALDLGGKGTAVSEVRDGKVIGRWMVRDLKELEKILGANTPRARVAFEACREGWHVHEWLNARGHEPVMVDTTRVKSSVGIGQHGRKTDRIDADKLALALETGKLPTAHVLAAPRRELRALLGVRATLVGTRAQYITTIRGLARSRGVKLPACQSASFVVKVHALQLEESVFRMIEPLLSTMPQLDEQILAQEARLDVMAKEMPEVRLLATAPGVGMITACAFVSVIDYPDRFPNGHAVSSYLGLAPAEFSSGGDKQHQRLGGITKQGNNYARTVLVEAAQSVLRASPQDDPLAKWGRDVEQRRGRGIAAVAVARRLAGILWAMWHTNTAYNCQLVKDAEEGWEEQHRQRVDAALGRSSRKFKRRLGVGTSSPNGNRIPQQPPSRRGSPRTRQSPTVAP